MEEVLSEVNHSLPGTTFPPEYQLLNLKLRNFMLHGKPTTLMRKDTNDIIKKLGKVKAASLLNGGDETSKNLLLLWPLVLEKYQELAKGSFVFGVTECHVF